MSVKGKFLNCAVIYKDYLKHTIMVPLVHFKFTLNAIAIISNTIFYSVRDRE